MLLIFVISILMVAFRNGTLGWDALLYFNGQSRSRVRLIDVKRDWISDIGVVGGLRSRWY